MGEFQESKLISLIQAFPWGIYNIWCKKCLKFLCDSTHILCEVAPCVSHNKLFHIQMLHRLHNWNWVSSTSSNLSPSSEPSPGVFATFGVKNDSSFLCDFTLINAQLFVWRTRCTTMETICVELGANLLRDLSHSTTVRAPRDRGSRTISNARRGYIFG